MDKTQNPMIVPLFYLTLGIATYTAINAWTFWPAPYKYVLPLAFAIVAVIDFFVRLNNQGPTTKPVALPKTVPAPPKVAVALAVEKPVIKKDEAKPNEIADSLKALAISVVLIALVVMGIGKLFQFINASNQAFIASARGTTVVHAFPIDHTYNQTKELSRLLWIDPGKTYNLFELESGQHWKWYFRRNLEYRIMATGREPFIQIQRHPDSGQEPTADRKGMLQVRTKTANNEVEAYRLRAYFID